MWPRRSPARTGEGRVAVGGGENDAAAVAVERRDAVVAVADG